MKEEVFRYGENNCGLGMVSLPSVRKDSSPVVVTLNAGLVHREGPFRMSVLICRALSQIGYIAIRVNQEGRGDTPSREGLSNRQAVALDWQFIKQSIVERFGPRKIILIGLCSGADDSILIAANDPNVCGLVLIDLISPMDKGFRRRKWVARISNYHKWRNLPYSLLVRFQRWVGLKRDADKEMIAIRDKLTLSEMQNCFCRIVNLDGKILAIFTSNSMRHYNQQGQFARALDIPGIDQYCEEIFWPLVSHTFTIQSHRDRLVEKISAWAHMNLEYFSKDQS